MARTFGGATTVKLTSALTPNATTETLAIWARRTGDGGGSFGRMFASGVRALLNYNDGGGTTGYQFTRTWTGGTGQWITNALPSINVWHHICVTYDGGATTNDPIFYVDGASVAHTEQATPATALSAESAAMVVGNRPTDNREWQGDLAEAVYYQNVILTAGEIKTLYLFGPARLARTPAFWYRIGVASPEPDWSGSGNAGTLTGTAGIADHPYVAAPFGFNSGWDGAFTAAAAPPAFTPRLTLLGVG